VNDAPYCFVVKFIPRSRLILVGDIFPTGEMAPCPRYAMSNLFAGLEVAFLVSYVVRSLLGPADELYASKRFTDRLPACEELYLFLPARLFKVKRSSQCYSLFLDGKITNWSFTVRMRIQVARYAKSKAAKQWWISPLKKGGGFDPLIHHAASQRDDEW